MAKTVAIIDFAHAGTTMLAGVCEILGIPMVGRNYKPMRWEDLDVITALQNEAAFVALVEQRDALHDLWGFKYPGAWKFQPLLERHLRNPIYLAIFKEPVAVTRRRFGKITPKKVLNTITQFQKAAEGMLATTPGVHMLSYEQAIVTPWVFVRQIVKLTGARPTPGQVDAAIEFIQPSRRPRQRYPEIEPWI
jgi:hypothetical protein